MSLSKFKKYITFSQLTQWDVLQPLDHWAWLDKSTIVPCQDAVRSMGLNVPPPQAEDADAWHQQVISQLVPPHDCVVFLYHTFELHQIREYYVELAPLQVRTDHLHWWHRSVRLGDIDQWRSSGWQICDRKLSYIQRKALKHHTSRWHCKEICFYITIGWETSRSVNANVNKRTAFWWSSARTIQFTRVSNSYVHGHCAQSLHNFGPSHRHIATARFDNKMAMCGKNLANSIS